MDQIQREREPMIGRETQRAAARETKIYTSTKWLLGEIALISLVIAGLNIAGYISTNGRQNSQHRYSGAFLLDKAKLFRYEFMQIALTKLLRIGHQSTGNGILAQFGT